jgi:acetolactate synthase I/II/III large subunit
VPHGYQETSVNNSTIKGVLSVKVYQALAETVVRQGTSTVFGLIGEDTMRLATELSERGVTYVAARHEMGAVTMAGGFARVSGAVGVAVVSRGPGFTNALTGLIWAARARVPLIVFAGDSPVGLNGPDAAGDTIAEPKRLDQMGLLAAAGVAGVSLISPDSAGADLQAIFDRARTGVTTVVNVPIDVMNAEAGSAATLLPANRALAVPPIDLDQIAEVADLLEATWAAARPVILAGRGAVQAGARSDLDRLGSLTGSLMATSLMAKSWFAGDPYDIGIVGTCSTTMATELLAAADLVLAFGVSLNPFTTFRGEIFPKARVVQVDHDASAFGRFQQPDIAVHADVREAASTLVRELVSRGYSHTGQRTPSVKDRIAAFVIESAHSDQSLPDAIDPRTALIAINKVLPQDRALVVDCGHMLSFACEFLSVPSPDAFILPIEYWSIGTAPGVAIGAALARRDRPTVLAVGDGGLMMALAELETAVRHRLPLIALVVNDSGFGSEFHMMHISGISDSTARYANPDFGAVAKALGADAVTIRRVADVQRLAGLAEHLDRPLLIDLQVNAEVRGEWVEFFYPPAQQGAMSS